MFESRIGQFLGGRRARAPGLSCPQLTRSPPRAGHFCSSPIYPGHGIKYVRGDSKSFLFINRKSKSYIHQKFNPRKIAWTLLYRRMHKKGTLEDTQKKTKRKVSKGAPKAVVGASLELIKQKRNQKPEVRAAAREAALREIKERAKAKQVGLRLIAALCNART